MNWPKGYETPAKRKEKAQDMASRIYAGEQDRKKRSPRWDACKSFYYNEPSKRGDLPYEGAANEHVNVTQVAVDALSTHVVGTITSQSPYCQATFPTTDQELLKRINKLQEAVWFMMERADIENALHSVAQPAGWSNCAHIKVSWDGDRPKFDVHEPDECGVYPSNVKVLGDGMLYWTSFSRRKEEIERLRKSPDETIKYLSEGSVSPTDPAGDKDMSYPSGRDEIPTTTSNTDDAPVKLYRVCFKDDDQKTWWGTISAKDSVFLKFDEVPEDYLECDLFKFAFKNETGTGYYSKGSVVNDLQTGQLTANELMNLLLDGIRMNSYGVMVSESYPGASTEDTYGPGDWLQRPGMSTAKMFNPQAQLNYVPETMWSVIGYQDKVARISSMGSGGQLKSGATATEAGGLLAGQQAGVNEYIKVFGRALKGDKGLFAYVQKLMYVHWEDWIEKLGPFLGLDDNDYEVFALPIDWKLSASTPSATPASQIQAVQSIVPLAAQMPGLGLDQYKIGAALVRNLQKMGVFEAGEFQLPEDPTALLQQLSIKTGIPPQLLLRAVENAKFIFQQELQSQQSQDPSDRPQGEQGMGILPPMGA